MIKCSICGRRKAFYLQIPSGHTPCRRCLEKLLIRRIKRTLSEIGVLKPKPTLKVIILDVFTYMSLAFAKLFSKIERRYGAKITYCIPENLEASIASNYIGDHTGEYIKLPYVHHDINNMIKYIDGLYRNLGMDRDNYDAVIVSFPRDVILALQIISLDSGNDACILEILEPVAKVHECTFINPAYHILSHDLIAYAYATKAFDIKFIETRIADQKFAEAHRFALRLCVENSDLLYSSIRGFKYILDLKRYIESSECMSNTPSKHQ